MTGPQSAAPSGLAIRLLSTVALLAAIALAAGVVAHWGWRWFGPTAGETPIPPRPERWAPFITAARLFGVAGAQPEATPASVPVATAGAIDFRLLGVLAGRDGKGEALFRLRNGEAQLIQTGEEIEPGVVLQKVEPNAVVVVQAGVARRLELRVPVAADASSRPAAPAVAATAPPTTGAAALSAACARPAGFPGELYILRTELLDGMIQQPSGWRGLLRAERGALTVSDASGFAAMLGLRVGDRLESANGVVLLSYEDVSAHVLKPLTASRQVVVSGARDGKLRKWLYVNAATCPAARPG